MLPLLWRHKGRDVTVIKSAGCPHTAAGWIEVSAERNNWGCVCHRVTKVHHIYFVEELKLTLPRKVLKSKSWLPQTHPPPHSLSALITLTYTTRPMPWHCTNTWVLASHPVISTLSITLDNNSLMGQQTLSTWNGASRQFRKQHSRKQPETNGGADPAG